MRRDAPSVQSFGGTANHSALVTNSLRSAGQASLSLSSRKPWKGPFGGCVDYAKLTKP